MRSAALIFISALALNGCCAGGLPAVEGASPPPFDAFQASMRLAVGMPREVAILRIGWTPISSEATTCGVLTGFAFPCELLRFGFYNNNQLDVYLAPGGDGVAVVNSWSIHKS